MKYGIRCFERNTNIDLGYCHNFKDPSHTVKAYEVFFNINDAYRAKEIQWRDNDQWYYIVEEIC